jgi:hypothetical protein
LYYDYISYSCVTAYPYLDINFSFLAPIMKTLPTSQKRPKTEFSTEMEFQAKRTRRGGHKLKPVALQSKQAPPPPTPIQNTTEPLPSSSTAPSLPRPNSSTAMHLDDSNWSSDIHVSTKAHARKTPGQVSFL